MLSWIRPDWLLCFRNFYKQKLHTFLVAPMSNVLVCVGSVFVADPLNVRDCIVPVHYQRSTDMAGPIIKIDLN